MSGFSKNYDIFFDFLLIGQKFLVFMSVLLPLDKSGVYSIAEWVRESESGVHSIVEWVRESESNVHSIAERIRQSKSSVHSNKS